MKWVVVLCILMFAGTLVAAERGSIRGKVVDAATKQPMIGANVLLTGTSLGATTDTEGNFVVNDVEENVYKLRASYVGYQTALKTDVRVVRGKATTLTIELLEDIVKTDEVTADASAFLINKQAPVSNYTYSREEINRTPGATGDIFRAIETLPGVSSSGGEFSAFSVRGASPKENIVLVDNIPVDRVTHFEGGSEEQEAQGGRFSIFAPNLIAEANFQAGGFSARYGGKNASFVNLKIKEGNRENFTMNGTYDLLGWEYNYEGPTYFLPTTTLVVSARHQDFKNVLNLTGQKDLGHPRFTDIIIKTTTDIDAKHRISLLGIMAPEKFDRTLDHVFESENLFQTELQRVREDKYVGGINWRWLTGATGFLQTTGYYKNRISTQQQGRAYTDPINGAAPVKESVPTRESIYTIKQREDEYGVKSAYTFIPSSDASFTAGLELSRAVLDYSNMISGPDTLFTYEQGDFRPDPARKYIIVTPDRYNATFGEAVMSYNVFVENSTSFGPLTINPGIRYEQNNLNNKNYISPRFSASYLLDPRTQLTFASGLYYQAPDYRIIAANPVNRSLANERAIHAILGVSRYLGENFKVTVEGYYKSFDDLIVRPDRTSQIRTNAGTGWASGVDFSVVRRFVDKWYGQLNYSYAQSKRNDSNGLGDYNSDFNQPHIFNILVGYELNDEWAFSAKWKFATGRPADSYIIHQDIFSNPSFVRYSQEITGKNSRRLDNFHTFNLRVDFRKQLGRFALVSFLDILNVYGRLNVNEERFLERGGVVEKKGFEMIPTFGLKLEL